jgi:hypothetical protein
VDAAIQWLRRIQMDIALREGNRYTGFGKLLIGAILTLSFFAELINNDICENSWFIHQA